MKRILPLLLVLCLLFSVTTTASAESGKQHDYSQTANSGIRHEVCTSLLGTQVDSYYTNSYSFDALSAMTGNTLLRSLRDLVTDTHHYKSTYKNCLEYATKSDCENGDGVSVNLIYTGYSATASDYITENDTGWNREHIWPQNLGGYQTSGAGADMHQIRPADQKVNSTRSNYKYGYVTGGNNVYGSITSDLPGGIRSNRNSQTGNYFEPLDNAKGDVARMVLYMYVRYGDDSRYKCSDVTIVFQSVDVLLEWCALDPVDTWEMGRNEVIAAIQGNRNVFIDYPELAWLLFDKEIPAGLITPSSGIHPSAPETCDHSATGIVRKTEPTCTTPGYTGDIFCTLCSTTLSVGKPIEELGHTETVINGTPADCGNEGYTGDTICAVCQEMIASGTSIPATGAHVFGQWKVIRHPTQTKDGYDKRTCIICEYAQTRITPALVETTDPTEMPTEATTPEMNDEQPPTTEPVETHPVETTLPAETLPKETRPVETLPAETTPTETQIPETTTPTETEPTETTPDPTLPSTEQTEAITPTFPTETTQTSTIDSNQVTPTRSNIPWIIICIVILVGCTIGVVLYIFTEDPKRKKET